MPYKSIKEAYQKILMEMPDLNRGLTRDEIRIDRMHTITHTIDKHHDTANDLGNGHYHSIDGGEHYFYHIGDDKSTDALSHISDGVQEMFIKKPGVSSEIAHMNFKHALSHLKTIKSDSTHTVGSKQFWENIHSIVPEAKIHMVHDSGEEFEIGNKQDMTRLSDKIWSPSIGYSIRLKASTL